MNNIIYFLVLIYLIKNKKKRSNKFLNNIYFSKDYDKATKKISSFNFNNKFKEIKYNDFTLFIRQSNNNKYIIITSGIHGNEFITGSAIQCKIIEQLNNYEFTDECPNIIVVHCINKYGCSNSDRFNKNNIDLNRNNINFNEINDNYNESYKKITKIFNPKLNLFLLIKSIIKYGNNDIFNILLKGQNKNKKDLFYIGTNHEKEIIDFFKSINENLNDNSIIFHIDIHTGFKGDFKKFLLIQDEKKINFLKDYIFKNKNTNFINLSKNDLYKNVNGFLTFENNFIFLLNKYGKKKFNNLKYYGICQEFSIGKNLKFILAQLLFMKYLKKKNNNKLNKKIKMKMLKKYNPDKYKNFYINNGYEDFEIIFNYLKGIKYKI